MEIFETRTKGKVIGRVIANEYLEIDFNEVIAVWVKPIGGGNPIEIRIDDYVSRRDYYPPRMDF